MQKKKNIRKEQKHYLIDIIVRLYAQGQPAVDKTYTCVTIVLRIFRLLVAFWPK
jgi:hypothetical protein